MVTHHEFETHLATLRMMRDDMQWLLTNATGLDRRRVDRHQIAAVDFAIRHLQEKPSQGLHNALVDIAEHSSDPMSKNLAADALARESIPGIWQRAKPTLELGMEESGSLTLNGRFAANVLSMTIRRTGLAAYAWHEDASGSGHGDISFRPEVYSVLRTIVNSHAKR